jgi:UDP-N-acetylglucosamine--N-acetylmuramyl-(pentapeptide) pyrophosphoryl-undecaprenol N-acetylglucosamine transferase
MKENLNNKKIVFCGGHHTSALPIIDEIVERDLYKIIFIGRKKAFNDDKNDSLEFLDINKRKIKFYDLKTGKFYGKNPLNFLKIIWGFFQAIFILISERPRLIVSFGGYIAAPVVLAGFILRIPIITHEQTVVTGFGNKFISFFANKVLVTWSNSIKYFDEMKTEVIGLPIRNALLEKPKKLFELNKKLPTIFITCGKTGSHIINEFILNNLNDILQNYNVIHQAGDYSVTNDYQNLKFVYESLNKKDLGNYHLFKFMFDEEVASAFISCDFIVSRSGAHTVYEILHFKKKAILIPIPWVSFNEQYLNAKIVHNLGLGLILEEDSLNYDNFISYAKRILVKDNIDTSEIDKIIKLDAKKLFIDEISRQLQEKK